MESVQTQSLQSTQSTSHGSRVPNHVKENTQLHSHQSTVPFGRKISDCGACSVPPSEEVTSESSVKTVPKMEAQDMGGAVQAKELNGERRPVGSELERTFG